MNYYGFPFPIVLLFDAKVLEAEINGSICAATSSSLAWLSLSCLLRILGYS